jgi:hypothetical protein
LPKKLLHDFAHLGHAGHTADHHHFVNRDALISPRRQRAFLQRLQRALDEVIDQLFQIGAGDHFVEVLGTILVSGDERQVDFGRLGRGQFDLRLFSRFLQTLQRQLVLGKVNAFGLLEIGGEEFDQLAVEIFTAQEGVAVGRLHFEHAVADFEDRNVERAAAKVVNRDRLVFVLVEAIGQRSRRRLVDDAQHFKARDLASVLGCLTLGVVEIGRHGDDGLRHGFAQIGFRRFLHLLQDEGRNLRRRIILATGLDPSVAILALDNLNKERVPCLSWSWDRQNGGRSDA